MPRRALQGTCEKHPGKRYTSRGFCYHVRRLSALRLGSGNELHGTRERVYRLTGKFIPITQTTLTGAAQGVTGNTQKNKPRQAVRMSGCLLYEFSKDDAPGAATSPVVNLSLEIIGAVHVEVIERQIPALSVIS